MASIDEMIDQMIDSYIDEAICNKIVNWEYVDFSKSIPKPGNSLNSLEEHRMEIVNKNGLTYLSPMSDHAMVQINSFAKWNKPLGSIQMC